LSVTWGWSVVFSGYTSFLHPIFESGVRHHNPNPVYSHFYYATVRSKNIFFNCLSASNTTSSFFVDFRRNHTLSLLNPCIFPFINIFCWMVIYLNCPKFVKKETSIHQMYFIFLFPLIKFWTNIIYIYIFRYNFGTECIDGKCVS